MSVVSVAALPLHFSLYVGIMFCLLACLDATLDASLRLELGLTLGALRALSGRYALVDVARGEKLYYDPVCPSLWGEQGSPTMREHSTDLPIYPV